MSGVGGGGGDGGLRGGAQTRSDACSFVFEGWKYPANLNRKERRRIQFSGEVDPWTYPGAQYVGTHVPNGACDEGLPVLPPPPRP